MNPNPCQPPGRSKGSKNKVPTQAKENIVAVFIRLGGTSAMAKWATENQTEFYRIYSRLLPHEHTGAGGGPINIEDVGDKELARRLAFVIAQAAHVQPE